jgi:hypothetical protein
MTVQKSFKRLVRTRMEKTGESYTAARAKLLAGDDGVPDAPKLATSDAEIRRRTGRGWEEWFDVLDAWGATERSHRDIAKWLAAEQLGGISALAWDAQAITHGYELTRAMRQVGEHEDGFRASVSRTIGASAHEVYAAFLAAGWDLSVRTATAPKRARFDCPDGTSRVHVVFDAKAPDRTTVALTHVRLRDAAHADAVKAQWRERLGALRERLER